MAAPGENLRINPDRLWDSLMEMAKIGPGVAGGNNRQTLTDEDGEGRHLFKRWCEAAGLDVGVDHMPHTHLPGKNAFTRGEPEHGAELADELERIVTLHDP